MDWSRLQLTNRILDYYSLRPRTCPFTKYVVFPDTIFKANYEASLRLCGIAREQKRKLIELLQILIKDCVKVLVTRVYIRFFLGSLHLGLFNHFLVSKYQSVGLIGATTPEACYFCSSVVGNQKQLPLAGQPCIDLQVAAHKRTRLPLPESQHAPAICGATILLETLQCERPRADVKSAPASNAGDREKGIQPECKYRTMSESQCFRK